jgi:hypothetical protein
MVSKSFRPQNDPGVNSSSNRNEYQEYFWPGFQGSRCVEITSFPPLFVHVYVSKSGSLNLLESSRPVICLYRDCFTISTKSNFHTFIQSWRENNHYVGFSEEWNTLLTQSLALCRIMYENEFNSTNLDHNVTYHNNSSYKLHDQHTTYSIVKLCVHYVEYKPTHKTSLPCTKIYT